MLIANKPSLNIKNLRSLGLGKSSTFPNLNKYFDLRDEKFHTTLNLTFKQPFS